MVFENLDNPKGFLSNIEGIKPMYFLPEDNLISEVMIPCLKVAKEYSCMAGYFESKSLRELAPGLVHFVSNDDTKMRLLISPNLSPQDRDAIESGYHDDETVLKAKISELFDPYNIDQYSLEAHTLHCLAYLIAVNRVEIQIVLVKQGIFHPKVHIFSDDSGQIVAHGSANQTQPGLSKNFEQVSISTSWNDLWQAQQVDILSDKFDKLWIGNANADMKVFTFPEAIKEKIIKDWHTGSRPTESEYWAANNFDEYTTINNPETNINNPETKRVLTIPEYLEYETGDFAHQGEAVAAWEQAGRRGILAMCTGSGKTISALICAAKLAKTVDSLLVVIAVPYRPLLNQWERDVNKFSVIARVPNKKSSNKMAVVEESITFLKIGASTCEVLIITHDMLCTEEFQNQLNQFDGNYLLIADEVHGLGIESFLKRTPDMFEFRLGLSATPERQYDEVGTSELFEYFGDQVYDFPLEKAIGKCLVEYDYFPHIVELEATELQEWIFISEQIKQKAWKLGAGTEKKGSLPPDLAKLYNARRIILEQASGKLSKLKDLLSQKNLKDIKHTLIYASEKEGQQLKDVNKLVGDMGIIFHQVTGTETTNMKKTDDLLNEFGKGDPLQVLTAMRVLDEGVDIPQISTAYILASTTVEKQWVQRRGRVLRKCPSINKEFATIHDFLVVPPFDHGGDDVSQIVTSELTRAIEFAITSRNATVRNGPLDTIIELRKRYVESNISANGD